MAACYMLGHVKAEEIERMVASMQTPCTNRVYQAKHLEAMLPARVVESKKTRKQKNASHDQGSKEEPCDDKREEAADVATDDQPISTREVANPHTTTKEVLETSASASRTISIVALKRTVDSSAPPRKVKRVRVKRSTLSLPMLPEEDERESENEEGQDGWVEHDSTTIP